MYYSQKFSFSDIEKALYNEIHEMKKEGPIKTNLYNGRLIYNVNNPIVSYAETKYYYYLFELEEEKVFPVSLPLKLIIDGNEELIAEVVVYENFSILLTTDKYIGENINEAIIVFEPWIFYQELINRLNEIQINPNNYFFDIANKIFINYRNLFSQNESNSNLYKGQETAIKLANTQDITFMWGPPGTGKTETLAKIVINFLKENKRILILSTSNVAVDEAIVRIIKLMYSKSDLFDAISDGKILRYGYYVNQEIKSYPNILINTYIEKEISKVFNEFNKKYRGNFEALINKGYNEKAANNILANQFKKIKKEITYKKSKEYLSNANVIGTTLAKLVIDENLYKQRFDVIIIDEISMVALPYILYTTFLTKEKFIGIGDFMQLPPVVLSEFDEEDEEEYSKWLKKDIFNFIEIPNFVEKSMFHPWLVMLDEQRRMHTHISNFVNKLIYKNLLKDYANINNFLSYITNGEIFSKKPVTLIDVSDMPSICLSQLVNKNNKRKSRYNILNAYLDILLAMEMIKNKTIKNIGIVTPYRLQSKLIKAIINDLYKDDDESRKKIKIATIHQFQGSECDIIIFDTVESYRMRYISKLLASENSKNLINVAITRAKGKLIVIANKKYLINDKRVKKMSLLDCLIKYSENKNYVKAIDLYKIISNSGKNIKFYHYDEAKDYLLSLFFSAERSINISIPSLDIYDKEFLMECIKHKKDIVSIIYDERSEINNDVIRDLFFNCNKIYLSDFVWLPFVIIDSKYFIYGFPNIKSEYFSESPIIIHEMNDNKLFNIYKELNNTFKAFEKPNLNKLDLKYEYYTFIKNKRDNNNIDNKIEYKNDKKNNSLQGFLNYINESIKCPHCKQSGNLYIDSEIKRKDKIICANCNYSFSLEVSFIEKYLNDYKPKCKNHNADIKISVHSGKIYPYCSFGCKLDLLEI